MRYEDHNLYKIVQVSARAEDHPKIFCPACGTQATPNPPGDPDDIGFGVEADDFCEHVTATHYSRSDGNFIYVNPKYENIADELEALDYWDMDMFMEKLATVFLQRPITPPARPRLYMENLRSEEWDLLAGLMFLELEVVTDFEPNGVYDFYTLTAGFDFMPERR